MSAGEATRETVKWILGIISAILLFSIKYSIDTYTDANRELKVKVDKVYDFTTNHDVRMAIIEKELEQHRQQIFNLQISNERISEMQDQSGKKNDKPTE